MITDADIEKLKGTFATKEDLVVFATKDDLKAFATKEELGDFRVEVAERLESVETDVKYIRNTLDGIAGAIQAQQAENGAGAAHLKRHDRQIAALAEHAGVSLPN